MIGLSREAEQALSSREEEEEEVDAEGEHLLHVDLPCTVEHYFYTFLNIPVKFPVRS